MKRVLLVALIFSLLQVNAMAANTPVIVQLGPLGNITSVLRVLGGSLLDSIPGTNIYLVNLPNLPIVSPLLKTLLGIVSIEVDKIIAVPGRGQMGILTVGNTAAADWYRSQPELQRIRAASAHSFSRGRGIVVADLNSIVDYSHPALRGHLTSGYDLAGARAGYAGMLNQSEASFLDQSEASFLDQSSASFLDQSSASFLDQSEASFLDQSEASFLDGGNPAHGHGTLCAAIIAAVAPESMIMPLRVFDDSGNADVFSIAKAIHHAVRNGAQVINLSFGMAEQYGAVQNALAYAAQRNVVVVASAGNANTSTPQFPASVSTVIAVAAVDLLDKKASFSNFGSSVFVDAPGVNIISAYPGGRYAMVSGTSYSAPMVAGEAALIMSVKNGSAKSIIGSATVNIDAQNPSYTGKLGRGRIDILEAVR